MTENIKQSIITEKDIFESYLSNLYLPDPPDKFKAKRAQHEISAFEYPNNKLNICGEAQHLDSKEFGLGILPPKP
uniref:Uncharacterized protein n=1 Tax=Romanomermis culicivorax TaxID=13658 RepID=A0A915HKB2_ROMCU